MSTLTVSIVLYQSRDDIVACLAALAGQTRAPDDVVILDNASTDGGLDLARRTMPDARFLPSPTNIGFAAGQNRAMDEARADLHLVLNPDCRLAPEFLANAVAALEGDPPTGSVSGRLLRFTASDPDGGPLIEQPDDTLDSTGMVALRNRRVLDRGTDEPAAGRETGPAYIFGASGAAALYRRSMLEDVAFGGEIYDEAFFAYREDVDLAWRAQLLGWRCRYEPTALARHRRRVAPGRRASLPSMINRLSIANRWRMIAKNETLSGWRRDWWQILPRDAAILGHSALREPRSLAAILDVAGDARRLRARRRDTMRRRRVSDDAILAWFGRSSEQPVGDA